MKKFVKYGTIFGCVLVLAGAGISTAAFALGADPARIWAFADKRLNHPAEIYGVSMKEVMAETVVHDEAYVHENQIGETQINEIQIKPNQAVTIAVADDPDSFEDWRPLTEYFAEVSELDITVAGGYVQVYGDEDAEELAVFCDTGNPEHVSFRDMDRYKKLKVVADEGEDYQIRIPRGWILDSLEVEVREGTFDGTELAVTNAEFVTIGGNIYVYQTEGKYTTLESDNGAIYWSGDESPSRVLEAEASNGGIVELTLNDGAEPDSIGYEMEYENAVIDFFGDSYEGSGSMRKDAAQGGTQLELDAEEGGVIYVQ